MMDEKRIAELVLKTLELKSEVLELKVWIEDINNQLNKIKSNVKIVKEYFDKYKE